MDESDLSLRHLTMQRTPILFASQIYAPVAQLDTTAGGRRYDYQDVIGRVESGTETEKTSGTRFREY